MESDDTLSTSRTLEEQEEPLPAELIMQPMLIMHDLEQQFQKQPKSIYHE